MRGNFLFALSFVQRFHTPDTFFTATIKCKLQRHDSMSEIAKATPSYCFHMRLHLVARVPFRRSNSAKDAFQRRGIDRVGLEQDGARRLQHCVRKNGAKVGRRRGLVTVSAIDNDCRHGFLHRALGQRDPHSAPWLGELYLQMGERLSKHEYLVPSTADAQAAFSQALALNATADGIGSFCERAVCIE